MDDNRASFWSRHLTGIIQCVFSAYCAVFATWEHFHPARSAASTNGASALYAPASVPVTIAHSIPFLLWIGIVGLALSVAIPALLKMIRRPKQPTVNEAAKDFANQENTKTYIRIGIQCERLFTPLQIGAFQLAKDMRMYLAEFEPKAPTQPSHSDTAERTTQWIWEKADWDKRVLSGFNRRFEGKQRELEQKLGELGCHIDAKAIFGNSRRGVEEYIPLYAATIVAAAHSLDGGVKLHPVKP